MRIAPFLWVPREQLKCLGERQTATVTRQNVMTHGEGTSF